MLRNHLHLESFQVLTFWREFSSAESAVDPTNYVVVVHPICDKDIVS